METEKEIIRDIWIYLRGHHDPPPLGTEECNTFWLKAADDLCKLIGDKWRNHPLAMGLGVAVYDYLDHKCKTAAGTLPHIPC